MLTSWNLVSRRLEQYLVSPSGDTYNTLLLLIDFQLDIAGTMPSLFIDSVGLIYCSLPYIWLTTDRAQTLLPVIVMGIPSEPVSVGTKGKRVSLIAHLFSFHWKMEGGRGEI